MATKIKKISELERVTTLSDSSNVVIEENGKAKRIAASNFAVGGSGTGGVSSWNDLTDKPFYDENVVLDIAWDGEIGDRVYLEMPIGDTNVQYFVHVDDYCGLDDKSAVGLSYSVNVFNDDGTVEGQTGIIVAEMLMAYSDDVCVFEAGFIFIKKDNVELMGLTFPKAGIYFAKIPDEMCAVSLSGEINTIKKIDAKFTNNPVTLALSYVYNADTGEYTDVVTDLEYNDVLYAWNNNQPLFVRTDNMEGERYPASIAIIEKNTEPEIIMQLGIVYKDCVSNTDMALVMQNPLIGGEVMLAKSPFSSGSGLPTEGVNPGDMMIFNGETGAWENVPAPEVVAAFAPSGLPEVAADNNGNVLTVVDGAWAAGEIEIPEIDYPVTSVNGMTGDVTIEIPTELPAITTELEGAFLRVVNGVPTWVVLENAEDGAY